jgi:ATP-dependent Lon protease
MQGDVMKESMNVAKSMAWSLLDDETRTRCLDRFEKTKEQGVHIHCPDGATPKDGPSAGAAITIAIYSLLSGRPILHNTAMTGEINLQGRITEIGGLEHKILGGVRAGVTKFLYPVENQSDLDKFVEKYGTFPGVQFAAVSRIEDTFHHLF